ncbi:MAG: GntR family transcriptional regulator [Planctomycetota bacterium]
MTPFHCLLDRHSGEPVYRQIVDQVRYQVASGALAVGDELPSTRGFGAAHGVNPMTVSKAYAELERLGVIERRPGLPSVIAARSSDESATDAKEELRRVLRPSVTVVRQLGVDPEVAIRVLRDLLANPE